MIEALAAVGFDFEFHIAGQSETTEYTEALKSLTAAKGISQKIKWLGPVEGEEKFRLYAQADLFVLPSFNENFANVVIEALSAGTPVMVSEEVGLADYVLKNGLGWTCGTDAASIAHQLAAIFSQKEKQAAIRQAAPGVVGRDFSPKKLTEQYVEQYRKFAVRG